MLATWNRAKGKERDALLWGDEVSPGFCCCVLTVDWSKVEYLVVCYDHEQRKVRLSLRQADILEALANDEELLKQGGGVPDVKRGEAK